MQARSNAWRSAGKIALGVSLIALSKFFFEESPQDRLLRATDDSIKDCTFWDSVALVVDKENLSQAIIDGYVVVVEIWLDQITDTIEINEPNDDGYTPLQLAAMHGQRSIVKLLIDHGAHLDSSALTALHLAVAHGHMDIMQLLLDCSVNADDYGAAAQLTMCTQEPNRYFG